MRFLLVLLFLVSCTNQEPPTTTAPQPKPVINKFKWNHEYNDHFLIKSIKEHGKSLLTVKPKDWNQYISVWPTTEQGLINFWGNILVEMAYWESKWDGSKKYKENFKDRNGKYIYSRGLFQLSLESGLGYKCPFRNNQDIHVDSKNIECAVRILDRWVGRDKVISGKYRAGLKTRYLGGARYWAVLRGHRDYTVKSLNAVKAANK